MSGVNSSRWAAKLAAIDANLLVALDALIQESNVTRAARRIGITQSAMSQALGRLRTQFDDPILVRVGRQMEPTPFAQRIKPRLREAIGNLELVVQDRPGFDPATASNRFVVAAVDYVSLVLLPPLHKAMSGRAPSARLAVQALGAGSIAPKLEEGTVDLYVGVRGNTERGLSTEPLFTERLAVVVRAEHPLATEDLTPEGYVRWPHIHVSPRQETGSIVDRALADLDLTRNVAMEVPYFALVPGLLADSDLVATVPASVGHLFAAEHDLVTLAPPIPLPEIDICIAWHPRFAQQPGLAWLKELVREVAGEL